MTEPLATDEEDQEPASGCVQVGESIAAAEARVSRNEKRKAAKKEKRKQIRKELAEKTRAEEEARLNDPEEQQRIKLEEERENERLERERREFEERERLFLEELARKKAVEEELKKRFEEEEESNQNQATKVASDAWKLMSTEEKAKYTLQAREVWDDYLSLAPAREPKPRKQTNLVTRCSPGRVFNVIKHLTPEQKDVVKSLGLGSLLSLRCRTLRRSLCLWLLERFNTVRRSLEICGERIPLCPRVVELVMGLVATGKDVVTSGLMS